MARNRDVVAGLFVVGSLALSAGVCRAYTFKNIADSDGQVKNFSSAGAAINQSGVVAFMGTFADNSNGIFTGDGGTIKTIAANAGSLTNAFLNAASINDSGTVAFVNADQSLGLRIFTGNGDGQFNLIASHGSFFSSSFQITYPTINAGGAVAFAARLAAGGQGIFVGNGGPITTIASSSLSWDEFGFAPDINDHGTCAFTAQAGIDVAGVFAGNGADVTTIADTRSGQFTRFGVGAGINNAGDLAFSAGLPNGGSAVVVSSGGTLHTIASSPTGQLLSVPDINNSGSVAFLGSLDGIGYGIYNGPDPLLNKVIANGDPLFGSTVMSVGFLHGLNDKGDIAFSYILNDGRMGIAVAVVPEPASAAAILLLICGCVRLPRRRAATGANDFQAGASFALRPGDARNAEGLWKSWGRFVSRHVGSA